MAQISFFLFMSLPFEIRQIVYYHTLVATESLVPRHDSPSLPGLEYQCKDGIPRFHYATPHGSVSRTTWTKTFRVRQLPPVHHTYFAFHLLLASRQVYKEAATVFYESHLFVFQDRYSMHTFLAKTKSVHLELVRSICMCFWKSSGGYTEEVMRDNPGWKLSTMVVYGGPRLSNSITALQAKCPKLRYLELWPSRSWIAVQDIEDIESKPFQMWDIVQKLSLVKSAHLSNITFSGEGSHKEWTVFENDIQNQPGAS